VVTVGREAYSRDHLASLAQRDVHGKLVVIAVEILYVLSDYLAFKILPWTAANAVTRINGRLAIGILTAQISAPGFAPSAISLSQLLAIAIRPLKATEISPFPRPKARDKKRHVRRLGQLRLLRLGARYHCKRQRRNSKCT